MGNDYNYKEINSLADLKKKQAELLYVQEQYQEKLKQGIKIYLHQHSPGYIAKKYTKKPREKVLSVFNKVKSWFSKKRKP
ncbi:hypothetical protein [Pedobacter gandavensis]|uniref:hypothetical protein n=1 Tax=Pedobacter gandavensis TaxID=2679963 RepID=UPI00292FC80E|nr:hypothetical protein [Pedobacter gandavensis]